MKNLIQNIVSRFLQATMIVATLITLSSSAQSVSYYASTNGPYGVNGTNGGLNLGHMFSVTGTNIQIDQLGVYDFGGDGLTASHTVTLFANAGGVYYPIAGGSVVVPAGTNATLLDAYRFEPLASPISLPPGNYAVIAYQLNGWTNSDPYSDQVGTNNGLYGAPYINETSDVYEFATNQSVVFPGTGGGVSGVTSENFGSASFTYTLSVTSDLPISALMLSPLYYYANLGGTATLTLSDYGSPPIYYQWYYGNGLTPIPGATNSVLVLSNVQPIQTLGNEGVYSASASNPISGQVLCQNPYQVTVTVLPPVAPLKIMPLGDSITYGLDAPGGYRAPLYNLAVGVNFNLNLVGTQSNNPAAWLPQPDHEGHPGFRIDQIYSGFLTWVNSIPAPDVILLLIGTNDYGQDYDTIDATNRLDQLITLIATNQPDAKLFVANLTVRTDNPAAESAIESTFNPYVPVIVSNHFASGQSVYFVDLHSALTVDDLSDGLHPNQGGYDKMAAAWLQAVVKVVPPPGSTNATVHFGLANATLNYSAVPGFEYVTQRSTNLIAGHWVTISTNTAPSNGLLQVTDGFSDLNGHAPLSGFYRLILQ